MSEQQTPPSENDKNLINVNIEDEMKGAYLDYAMSVIVGRALPDVRDGLKPVHRRVLYAMYDLGNTHDKAYKKSARVVGDVIGKYHPHGDTAVYHTIVRMAQDFSLRYPLIDGQGNFGSIDGDAAAAMRYTEIRMDKISAEILADLEKETVAFGPNYDDSLKEPLVMPSRIPNLLINGSTGIAVGMATNIPPHNLTEIIDATLAIIKTPTLKTDDLLQYVKGPDFPTAGTIFGGENLRVIYHTGRGSIIIRGKAEIETAKNDREKIIITELPYQVNKAKLIEKIADLVRDKRLEGISDLRDESDRTGMRIVVDIKKGESASVVMNRLYSMTQLQESFGVSLLAIHHNQPKIFNLRDMIWAFVEHRKEVVLKRTFFDLKKAEARAHILEGLKIAVENLDAVVALIRAAPNPEVAKKGLIEKFALSEIQAKEILEMRLQRLTGLERDKIITDYKQILELIAQLKKIIESDELVFEIISKELQDIRDRYGDKRRTAIEINENADLDVEDLIEEAPTLVTITHQGYIKRADPSQFKVQNRGGKGIRGVATGDEDFVTSLYSTSTKDYLLFITDKGKLYWLKVYKIPEATRVAKGRAIVNLLQLEAGEKVKATLAVQDFKDDEYIAFVTRKGLIKKTALSEFKNIRQAGIIAVSIEEGDDLIAAKMAKGNQDFFICTSEGISIRFSGEDVRSMGRTAYGVKGVTLDPEDAVVGFEVLDPTAGTEILVVTEYGYGKRTPTSEYRVQSRGGKGIITMKTTEKNGKVISACQVQIKDNVMLVSNKGQMIRVKIEQISEQGRNTQGVRVMNVSEGEKVVATEYVPDENESVAALSTDA